MEFKIKKHRKTEPVSSIKFTADGVPLTAEYLENGNYVTLFYNGKRITTYVYAMEVTGDIVFARLKFSLLTDKYLNRWIKRKAK